MNNFDEQVDRRSTNDLKWQTKAIESYINIKVREDMIPMWIADMDFKSPASVTKAIEKRIANGIYGYCTPGKAYFDSIRFWMNSRHQFDIDIDKIHTMPSVVSSINVGIRILTEEGDGVIIQQPVYNPFKEIVERTKRKVITNTLINNNGYYEMDFELLEKQASSEDVKLLILCSPHNPVGRVWKREELERVDEICRINNVSVISDEIHSDIIFGDNKHIVFNTLSEETSKNTILCISPSKTFNVAGLKMSNVFIEDDDLRERYIEKSLDMSLDVKNTFGVEMLPAAYSEEGTKWLEELIVYLEGNISFVEEYIKDNMSSIKLVKPEGTYLAWLDLSKLNYDDKELLKKFSIDAGVICVPGIWFGEVGSKHMRLNIGTTRENLKIALDRLKATLY